MPTGKTTGSKSVTMDGKGRVVFPVEYRDVLKNNIDQQLFLAQHPSEVCLQLWGDRDWRQLYEKKMTEKPFDFDQAINQALNAGNYEKAKMIFDSKSEMEVDNDWELRKLDSAVPCEMDAMGRILIPKHFRILAKLISDQKDDASDRKKKKASKVHALIVKRRSNYEIWRLEVYINALRND